MSNEAQEQKMGVGIIGVAVISGIVYWWMKPTPPPAPPAPVPVVIVPAETKPEKVGGLMDGTIDAARDRAIAKAGTSWPEIQKWVGQFRRVMDALDPINKPRAEAAPITPPNVLPTPPANGREIKLPDKQPAKQTVPYIPNSNGVYRWRVLR